MHLHEDSLAGYFKQKPKKLISAYKDNCHTAASLHSFRHEHKTILAVTKTFPSSLSRTICLEAGDVFKEAPSERLTKET